MLEKLTFNTFKLNLRKEVLVGVDIANKFIIKIQLVKNPNKAKNIEEEYEVMRHLNEHGCQSCPTAYEFGTIEKSEVLLRLDEKSVLDSISEEKFQYIIQDFIPDGREHSLADIMFSMIEQKKLGVYQGDIKPANIRFHPEKRICYIIDYDQSVFLSKEQMSLNNNSFLKFCSKYDKDRYGFGNWLRHFPEYTQADVEGLFNNNSFNLAKTTIFKVQTTTNSESGIYHSVDENDIFIKGSRNVETRASLLDDIEFKPGEKVLDVGCNSGLLSWYFHDRGCCVTGVDNDPHIVTASKMVSNILEKNIQYYHLDLDDASKLDRFDTIALFSVFHHTRNITDNAKKVTNSCSRIILEARIDERGGQPTGGHWISTSRWSFENVQQLVSFCERIFEGFKLKKNLGIGSKRRYILEFIKQGDQHE